MSMVATPVIPGLKDGVHPHYSRLTRFARGGPLNDNTLRAVTHHTGRVLPPMSGAALAFAKKSVPRRVLLEYAIKRGGATIMSLSFAPGIILLSAGATIDERENPRTVGPNQRAERPRGSPDAGKTLLPGPTWTLRHDQTERSGGEATWGGPHARRGMSGGRRRL